ncbi:hypothetical protein FHW64_004510 [Variovorax sp. Sphag1AA]|nr:hypothetical protein [Variovorax sp. Sphag1AA]
MLAAGPGRSQETRSRVRQCTSASTAVSRSWGRISAPLALPSCTCA